MAKQWYVIHTYSGHENKVKANIDRKVMMDGLGQYISQVIIPSEAVAEVRDGKRVTTSRKVFPGYVMLEMDLPEVKANPEEELKVTEILQKIQDIPGVTGFVGTGRGNKPVPLNQEEVDNILIQMGEKQQQKRPKAKQSFSVGERIKVIEGPFSNFYGVVKDFAEDKGKLTVEISIFGRPTPLELDVFQVERE
jgi:transcriptional antiterminator NusG